jgi:hypothetical protein
MSCTLSGCMSEQEWAEWEQKQRQKRIEESFRWNDVEYPGTQEEYIKAHLHYSFRDCMSFFVANCESVSSGSVYSMTDTVVQTDIEGITMMDCYELRRKIQNPIQFAKFEKEVLSELGDKKFEELIDMFSKVLNDFISKGLFTRGMTLEQVRVALQHPLLVSTSHLGDMTYDYENIYVYPHISITFFFTDGRLTSWSKYQHRDY